MGSNSLPAFGVRPLFASRNAPALRCGEHIAAYYRQRQRNWTRHDKQLVCGVYVGTNETPKRPKLGTHGYQQECMSHMCIQAGQRRRRRRRRDVLLHCLHQGCAIGQIPCVFGEEGEPTTPGTPACEGTRSGTYIRDRRTIMWSVDGKSGHKIFISNNPRTAAHGDPQYPQKLKIRIE